MPTLILQFKKRADAKPSLVLRREDGTVSAGQIAAEYGPVHDLAHYVVERGLGLSEGFLGLVASGWEIDDFEVKGTARRLPGEALLAECAAGELSREEIMHQFSSAEDVLWGLRTMLANMGRPDAMAGDLTAERLAAMRAELAALRRAWNALRPGETLELSLQTARRSGCPRPERPAGGAATQRRGR